MAAVVQVGPMKKDADVNTRLVGLESRLTDLQSLPQQLEALQDVPRLLDSALEALGRITRLLEEGPQSPATPSPTTVEMFRSPSHVRSFKRAKEPTTTYYSTASADEKTPYEAVMVPLIGQPVTLSRSNTSDKPAKVGSHQPAPRRPSKAGILNRWSSPASISSPSPVDASHVPRRPSNNSVLSNSQSFCSGRSRSDHPEDRLLVDILPGFALAAGEQEHTGQAADDATRSEPGSTCASNVSDEDSGRCVQALSTIDSVDAGSAQPRPSGVTALSTACTEGGTASSARPSWDRRAERRSKNSVISLATGSAESQEGLACMAGILHRTYEHDIPCCVLPPLANPRLIWDVLVLLATMITGVAVPLLFVSIGKGEPLCCFTLSVMCAVDVAWCLDILVNFRTGFFSGIGGSRQVLSPRRIAVRYAKGGLVFDLLAAWPLALSPPGAVGSSLVSFVVLALKLLRVPRLWPIVTRLQQKKSHNTLFLVFEVVLGILFLSHFLACVWRLALCADSGAECSHEYSLDQYAQDMYWVVMTMTTVGYGDVSARGTIGRLYSIVVMLTAPMYFGSIVTLLTHAMSRRIDSRIESKIVEAKRFMQCRRMPVELQRRVIHNLRHNLFAERLTSLDPSLLTHLSPAVQRELLMALLSRTVLKFPLFKGVTYSFVADLAQVHSWVQCLPGDLVVEEGQLEQEVVFVVHGRLILHGAEDGLGAIAAAAAEEDSQVAGSTATTNGPVTDTLCAGAWFGEACLFDRAHVRTTTVIALVESELAVLAAADFFRVMGKYPRLQERHSTLEKAFLEGRLHLSELSYRFQDWSQCPSVPLTGGRGSVVVSD